MDEFDVPETNKEITIDDLRQRCREKGLSGGDFESALSAYQGQRILLDEECFRLSKLAHPVSALMDRYGSDAGRIASTHFRLWKERNGIE